MAYSLAPTFLVGAFFAETHTARPPRGVVHRPYRLWIAYSLILLMRNANSDRQLLAGRDSVSLGESHVRSKFALRLLRRTAFIHPARH
jgi:hypothetical protein